MNGGITTFRNILSVLLLTVVLPLLLEGAAVSAQVDSLWHIPGHGGADAQSGELGVLYAAAVQMSQMPWTGGGTGGQEAGLRGASDMKYHQAHPFFFSPALYQAPVGHADKDSGSGGSNGGNPAGEGGSNFLSRLRRFEIVSFGTFPFTFLFSNIAYDLGRYGASVIRHGAEDERSLELQPTLFGERNLEQNERWIILGSAAGLSVVLAGIDLLIERSRTRSAPQRRTGGEPEALP